MTDALSTAYDALQFDDNFPAGIEDHFWFKARNANLDRTLHDAVRRGLVPAQPRILEVGCGTGVVVDRMLGAGHDIWGVELGRPPQRAAARDRITTGLLAKDLPAAFRAGVDMLMFLDVAEHVPDDVGLLRDSVAAFPRCTAVLVTVPARPEVWSTHDTHYGHFRRYTRTSLDKTLVAAGLLPRRTRYLFRSLYAAAALIKLTGRDRDPVMAAPARRWLHALVAAGLVAEDRLLGTSPLPGLSLLAVATVPR